MSTKRNPVGDLIRALAAVEVVREQRHVRFKTISASNSHVAAGDWENARGEMQQRIRRTREARGRLHRAFPSR